jgi:hypothetical protein
LVLVLVVSRAGLGGRLVCTYTPSTLPLMHCVRPSCCSHFRSLH